MKLNLRRTHKRRYPFVYPEPLLQPIYPNPYWSMDFMSDALYGGMKFRTFNIVDDFNREVLTIAINNSITSQYVTRTLEQLIEIRGVLDQIRMTMVQNSPATTSGSGVIYGISRWFLHNPASLPRMPLSNDSTAPIAERCWSAGASRPWKQ